MGIPKIVTSSNSIVEPWPYIAIGKNKRIKIKEKRKSVKEI